MEFLCTYVGLLLLLKFPLRVQHKQTEAKLPLGVSVFCGETDQSGCILASEASPLLQD